MFLAQAQQQDVLNAVQRLRQRADTAGYLKSTAQQKVTKATLLLLRLRRQISTAAPYNGLWMLAVLIAAMGVIVK